jgi:DNA-binding IclR family transcriptional regulator
MTAFLVVRDGDEALTLDVVEPRRTDVHVAYRPGTRHAVDRGAPGLALLAAAPAVPGERAEVTRARARGWATTRSEVLDGMAALAVPVDARTAVAVLWLAAQRADVARTAAEVTAAAAAVRRRLGS